MSKGEQTYIQEESLTGNKRFLKTTKMPIILPHMNKTGLLGIQIDVTDSVIIKEEKNKIEEEFHKEIEKLEAEIKALKKKKD
jgi:hypothetical protein